MPAQLRPYSPETVAAAAALIAAGEIVAVPTETVYGLAGDATNPDAVARIYAAKGRPGFNPLIVHVADLAAAERIAVFDDGARVLAARFWPGPLTLVLPVRAEAGIAPAVTAGLPTIAIRVPKHRAMQALLAVAGKPLAAPSANASNGISPTTAAHVASSLGDRVPLVIDDGATEAGLESTIVAGKTILRPGPITAAMITEFFVGDSRAPATTRSNGSRSLSTHEIGPSPQPSLGKERKVTAPGQLASHYAPAKPLRLEAAHAYPDEYLIGFDAVQGDEMLSSTADLAEAAANLFAALHRADAGDKPRIAVAPIPRDGLGEAINDRLTRAAHG